MARAELAFAELAPRLVVWKTTTTTTSCLVSFVVAFACAFAFALSVSVAVSVAVAQIKWHRRELKSFGGHKICVHRAE